MKKLFALAVLLTALTAAFSQPSHHITFNGTDQYMRIPHHEDFNIAADQSFTVTGWVRNETYTNYPRYVCKRDMSVQSAGSERTGYEFFGTGSAGQSLGLNTPTSTSGHALSIYTGVTGPAGEWMHFALVVDRPNNEIRIYHNGETNSSWVAPVNDWAVTNTHDVFIGAGNSGGVPTNFCNGSFGNIRFYSMALDPNEIAFDMELTYLVEFPTAMRNHLLAAYDFSLENINPYNNQVTDISENGHTAQLVNMPLPGPPEILDVTLTQETRKTGRGNPNDVILKAAVNFGGDNASIMMWDIILNLEGTTDLNDIERIKVYSTGTVNAFDERTLQGATLIGSATPASGDFYVPVGGYLYSGMNYLWIVAQVSSQATEGHVIDASLKSIYTDDQTFQIDIPSPAGNREIILAHTLLLQPGDYNSTNYRIPAVITAKDGSIVAVTDKRKYNEGDLPEDIDISPWALALTMALATALWRGATTTTASSQVSWAVLVCGIPPHRIRSAPISVRVMTTARLGRSPKTSLTSSLATTASSQNNAHGVPRSSVRVMGCAPPRVVSCLWPPSVRIRRKYSTTMPFIPTTTVRPGMCRGVPLPRVTRPRSRSWLTAAS